MTTQFLRPSDFRHETRRIGDLEMHMVIEGADDAPPMILLHGFPEFWYGWSKQIKPLAEAGYRVIVPDQRGYNLTTKRGPYDVFTLTDDIVALLHSFGYEKAIIVGHDWGGVIAWLFAARYPEMTEKVIVVNVPHPVAALDAVRRGFLPQIQKSWYIGAFQLPFLPELALSANEYNGASELMRVASVGTISEEELVYYRAAWAQPGALSAMINWYRAFFRDSLTIIGMDSQIHVPARLIWGFPDIALDIHTAEWTRDYCDNLDLVTINDTGHFVQHMQPERVTSLILEFAKGTVTEPVAESASQTTAPNGE